MAGDQKIPSWLSGHVQGTDLDRIEQAIQEVEKNTSGELVPVLVRRSSTVSHVPYVLFLLILVPLMIFYYDFIETRFVDHLVLIQLSMLVTSLGLTIIFSRLPFVQRWLTPKQDIEDQVNMRAELEFFHSNIKRTKDSTGILIFISLMEHRVVVLGDEAISSQIPKATWGQLIEKIIVGIKSKSIADGLIEGIHSCGEILQKNLPIQSNDQNELPNHLIIKE